MSDYYDASTGEEVTDSEAHDRFNDYLDEALGDVTVGTLTYPASRVLSEVDPIAYRCEFSDWTADPDTGLVESGYWVRALTDDGEVFGDDAGPDWYAGEDDARDAFQTMCELLADPDAVTEGPVTVQMYDTSDSVIAELRIA